MAKKRALRKKSNEFKVYSFLAVLVIASLFLILISPADLTGYAPLDLRDLSIEDDPNPGTEETETTGASSGKLFKQALFTCEEQVAPPYLKCERKGDSGVDYVFSRQFTLITGKGSGILPDFSHYAEMVCPEGYIAISGGLSCTQLPGNAVDIGRTCAPGENPELPSRFGGKSPCSLGERVVVPNAVLETRPLVKGEDEPLQDDIDADRVWRVRCDSTFGNAPEAQANSLQIILSFFSKREQEQQTFGDHDPDPKEIFNLLGAVRSLLPKEQEQLKTWMSVTCMKK